MKESVSPYTCPTCNNAADENVQCWYCTCTTCGEPEKRHPAEGSASATLRFHRFTPSEARKFSELTERTKALPPMTARQREEQRRSFVHGNVGMHNPAVTREVVDRVAMRLDQDAMIKVPRLELAMMDSLDPPEDAAQLSAANDRLMLCVPIKVKFAGGILTASRWYQVFIDEIPEDVRQHLIAALEKKEA